MPHLHRGSQMRLLSTRLVEEVLSPLDVGPSNHAHDVTAGVQRERTRLFHQLHVGFAEKVISLSAIARMTARHQVLPCGKASAGPWDHVIER